MYMIGRGDIFLCSGELFVVVGLCWVLRWGAVL